MTFEDDRPVRAFPSLVELYDKALITSSVTKVYGAGTLMGGWLIGPKRYINKAKRLKIYTVPMVDRIANKKTLEILRNSHKVLPEYFAELRLKEKLVSQWAAGRDDVGWSSPDGCAVGFLSYKYDIPSVELCNRLYTEKEVRVIPGEFFHLEKGFRLGMAGDYGTLKASLVAIDELLDSL
jgi:aspartate/methionine/tyrosine aminotransferase